MSSLVKNWSDWLKNKRFSYLSDEQKEQTLRWLSLVKDSVLERAKLKDGDTVIDIGTGTGLLAFGAYELLNGNGRVIASDIAEDCLEECKSIAEKSGITEGLEFLHSGANDISLPDSYVDVVLMRSVLVHIVDKAAPVKEFYRILKQGGRISIFEPVISTNTKYYELVTHDFPDYERFKKAEQEMMSDKDNALTNFSAQSLVNDFTAAGFKSIDLDLKTEQSTYTVQPGMVNTWFNTPPSPNSPTGKQKFMSYFTEGEVETFIENLDLQLSGKEITVKSYSAYISAVKE